MTGFNTAPSATDTSWLRTSGTDRVAQAVADVGKSLAKVAEYTENMFDPEKKDEITTKASELNIDPINETDADFNSAVNDNYDGDELDEETTNNLRTIILLQLATDTNDDGAIDTDKYDKNGDGNIDARVDIEQVVEDYISSGVINTKGFNQLLAATLMEYDDKDSLEGYIDSILDDNATDTTTPVPAATTPTTTTTV
jgi:hypothetical protein